MCSKAGMGLRQLKGSAKKHKEQEQIRPYQLPNDARRNQKAWKLTIHEQRASTLGNPERRTMKGSSWEDFQLGRKESIALGKNDEGKGSQKLSLKRWELEALKGEKPKVNSSRHTRTERQQETFKEETPKEENYEKYGRDQ